MARYIARRKFLATLVGGAVVAWPVAARAQQSGRLIRIGVLGPTLNNPPAMEQYQAFRTQLAELGFREGQNLTIDYGHLDDPRGPFVVAAELVRSRPDLIVTAGPETSLQAVVGASGFIPVVMIAFNFDPLARGYIPSLARPDGNITGLVFQQRRDPVPDAHLVAGHGFADGRHVGNRSHPFRPGHAQGAHLAAPDVPDRTGNVIEHHLHLTGEQVAERGGRAAVRYVNKIDAGHRFEQLA